MFELAQYGLPAILIPYPHASADHQTANARWMAEAGAATILPDAELTPAAAARRGRRLLADPGRLAAMAAASRALARPDAAAAVAREVLAAAGKPPLDRARELGARTLDRKLIRSGPGLKAFGLLRGR